MSYCIEKIYLHARLTTQYSNVAHVLNASSMQKRVVKGTSP